MDKGVGMISKDNICIQTYGKNKEDHHDPKTWSTTELVACRACCNNFVIHSVASNNWKHCCRKSQVWHIKMLPFYTEHKYHFQFSLTVHYVQQIEDFLMSVL